MARATGWASDNVMPRNPTTSKPAIVRRSAFADGVAVGDRVGLGTGPTDLEGPGPDAV